MKRTAAILTLTVLFLSSCKKEESSMCEAPIEYPTYLPLQVGNSWFYQDYKVDSLGNETLLQGTDSLYIASDTLINGNTYAVFKGHFFPHHTNPDSNSILFMYRDSSGYLVDVSGNVIFTLENFTDTLDSGVNYNGSDTLYTWYRKMDPTSQLISVPAGTFESYDCPTYFTFYFQSPPPNPRINHRYYAKDIGIIKTSYSFASAQGTYIEKRLTSMNLVTP